MNASVRSRRPIAQMPKERLTAFSDGVIAIIITIMVLELKTPAGESWSALAPQVPLFLSYALSFLYVAIYWNNHHHLMHAAEHVSASILWANTHLLFWMSLIPFSTAWMAEHHHAAAPVAVYGVSLLMPAIAYFLLQIAIVRSHAPGGVLASALGRDYKGKLSMVLYAAAIAFAFRVPQVSLAIYIAVAALWFLPDRRIERALVQADQGGTHSS